MPQLNIYIAEDLAEVLQRYRDALNLSQICSRALRQEVQKVIAATHPAEQSSEQSSAPRAPVNVERVLERLREVKRRQQAAYQDGAADAARWLEEEATLEDMRRFGDWVPETDPNALDERASINLDRFYAHLSRVMGKQGLFEKSAVLKQRAEVVKAAGVNEAEYLPSYVRGWHEAVIATWRQIKDQL
ncbi:MAG TPA: hypothetical protein VHS99_23885 [Chloroflexota bacterium]|jgi:hypothetical protein|nr:hypothetical protein [Chloroflexota bacterium]